ncbi:MAG: DUF2721 domain-containing protein [Ignavibacteria bacterium]|nr:DUF2721 domain-containing protein [Ignavibacteria bacterium]
MNNTIITGIEAIQSMLAPALGISATAMLLLSMHNRFSIIINRLRLLNEEKRRYHAKIADNVETGAYESIRYSSISSQLKILTKRCRVLRNAILSMMAAIMLFVLASLLIGVNIFISTELIKNTPLVFFSLGMLLVLTGIIYSANDVINSYRLTEVEVKGEV